MAKIYSVGGYTHGNENASQMAHFLADCLERILVKCPINFRTNDPVPYLRCVL